MKDKNIQRLIASMAIPDEMVRLNSQLEKAAKSMAMENSRISEMFRHFEMSGVESLLKRSELSLTAHLND